MMKNNTTISAPSIVTQFASMRQRYARSTCSSALRIVWAVGVASTVLVATSTAQENRRGNRPGNDRITVATAVVTTADVPLYVSAVGTVTARNTATVRARVAGQLDRVLFKEGQMVNAGDVLAVIDARPFQVVLDQAEGTLQRDQAQLENAQQDLKRYQDLSADNSIAKQQLDTQAALVRQYQATLAIDRGAVASAKLNVGYTKITAPVSGRTGLRQVDAGNLVSTTDTNGIVVITQIKPIDVVFAIPEDQLNAVMKQLNSGAQLPVDAFTRDGKTKVASGTLLTADNQIDTTTGTIKLKAQFANDEVALFPNQFVNMRLQLAVNKGVTVVSSAAVQQGSVGTYVYVVKPDNTVTLRTITTGVSNGDKVTVKRGLSAGERVVTDGLDKLREGATVNVAPSAEGQGTSSSDSSKGDGQPHKHQKRPQ